MKTDTQLQEEVADELAWDPAVSLTDIGVDVNDGVVTLSGHPASYAEKLAAEKAAKRVAGVKAVVLRMDIRLPHSDVRTDEDIANAVRSILKWTVGVSDVNVQVEVDNGWVTLRGRLDRAYQRHLAARMINPMRGVTGLSNLIEVHERPAGDDIGDSIRKALVRHVEREADHIGVSVRDGTVTLTGKVGSYAERSIVRGAAWGAPGVHAVNDDLTIG
ncbi:BON domain protein [Paraburkholderia xenovorans LB400]|jgi:osmotically-inducible protein OsmY|uniref:Phospholipid binding protein n=1 Tax=Paraburkholderia xenovorans (strain LB400) TaxID=266265 RepID=Q13JZ6_PARXL|nr:BON domain-containing protein [Paraburkholderia xenovorans]ABE35593.1 phospholipid binding protein [Paraburkholderia xenovorans LB400]AIP36584.1 BON domain protein [Paraburkholderia xenovorans LB400]NPT34845.1 BON domain-containing protein [Paraburkholderia xenovorans]